MAHGTVKAHGVIRVAAVTTCNLAGWDRYGRRMVESFNRFWAADVPLLIYSEDMLPVATEPFPDWFLAFKERHADNRPAHGHLGGRYDYTRDCVRFAHKVAAVTDAALMLDDDVLIWLDADTLTHAPVSTEWLAALKPDDAYIAWLDRARAYPECGFYMLSLRHSAHATIMRKWIALYESGAVFKMRETHDCVTLQRVIQEAEASGEIKVHSLSGGCGRESPHPLINSSLSKCFDHCKGPRKNLGRTPQRERVIKDDNPYWRA